MSLFQLLSANLAHRGTTSGGRPEDGASAVPACGVTIRTRAALGIVPAGITTGLRGARCTGHRRGPQARKSVSCHPVDQEARPKPSDGVQSPKQEPRWGAERRARPARTRCRIHLMRPVGDALVGAPPPSRFVRGILSCRCLIRLGRGSVCENEAARHPPPR
jgi:hypothetical protein